MQYQAYQDDTVRGMVDFAAMKAGMDIINSTSPAPHRLRLAELMAEDAWDYSDPKRNRAIQGFLLAIVQNPAILTTLYVGDVLTPGNAVGGDLEFVIAGQWDVLAESIYPELAAPDEAKAQPAKR